jgi:hypothetical protein
MSVAGGPSVISNGLVFGLDMASPVSYSGPITSNIAQAISVNGVGTSTGYSSTSTIQDEHIPDLGHMRVFTNSIQNNYTVYTPTNNNCCPSLHAWGGIAVSPSTLYTYGIVFRVDSGYTSTNYMYRYEYASNGGAYVTEGGVYSDANRVALGGGWYYAWGTFTTQATTNWLGHCGTFYYRYSNTTDRLSIAKVMIAPGNYAGMHPKFWPSTSVANSSHKFIDRSTTNSSITPSSLTYTTDGTFSFNGSLDSITLDNNKIPPTTNFTITAWVKCTNVAGSNNIVSRNGPYFMRIVGSKIRFNVYSSGTWLFQDGTTTLSNNVWYNLTMTYDGTTFIGYINGVQEFATAKTGTVDNNGGLYIGYTPVGGEQAGFSGSIALVNIYNTTLTSVQVQQNFNSLRGRYGI